MIDMTRVARPRRGFTLVELLIVIVIIGLLAAIGSVSYRGAISEARLATVQSDMRAVVIQQEMYYQLNHSYGTLANLSDVTLSDGVSVTVNHADNLGLAFVGSHAGVPATECGYFRGTVPGGSAGPATDEDEITCAP